MSKNGNGKPEGAIKRRDMLKVFSAVPAALIPLGTAVGAEQKPAERTAAKAASANQRKVFNNHEWETIKVLSDLIIPADEDGGSASQAGVPEFIDNWLKFQGGGLKAEILGGMTWLDLECNRTFGHDLISCTPSQQRRMLDRIAYPAKAAPEDSNYVEFFNHLRDLVTSGYFSSKTGVKDLPYLGNKPSNEWQGCPAKVLARIQTNLKAQGVGLSLTPGGEPAKS